MRPIRVIPVVLVAAALGGCGGGGGGSSSTGAAPSAGSAPAATTQQTTTATKPSSGADGAKVFASAGCAGCHTLRAAGATGNVGPNLDDLKLSADVVKTQVTNGGGGMPSFGGSLSGAEIAAVASYVSSNAGR